MSDARSVEGHTLSLGRRDFSDAEIEQIASLWIALVRAQGEKCNHPPRHGFSPSNPRPKKIR